MPTSPPETVRVPQGVLTRLREADAEQIALAVRESLEHLRPWMPWASESAAQVDSQRLRCQEFEHKWTQGSDYLYALRLGIGQPVIGTFGLHRRIGPRAIELGYWLHAAVTGQGHATQAAAALTSAALSLPDIDWVEIHTDQANAASAAIPRRLGYRLDRVDTRPPEAPAETGQIQIWVTA